MCFILATYELNKSHLKTLEGKWPSNPDGAGLTWHVKKGARADKGYFTWAELEQKLNRHLGQTVVVHLRNATHGVINPDNCHPFLTCEDSAFMCHNGILPAPWSSNRSQSDSAAMAKMLEPISIEQLLKDRNDIGRTIGWNKLVFLTNKGKIIIVNDDLGEFSEGKRTWVSQKTSVGYGFGCHWQWDDSNAAWVSGKKKAYKVLVNGKEVKDRAKEAEAIALAEFDEGPNGPNPLAGKTLAEVNKQNEAVQEYIKNLPK